MEGRRLITFQLTREEAVLVALGLSMVPKAAEVLARLERQIAMEQLLPWPEPPRLLIIERYDGAETIIEYYQDEQVDRIMAAITQAMKSPPLRKSKRKTAHKERHP